MGLGNAMHMRGTAYAKKQSKKSDCARSAPFLDMLCIHPWETKEPPKIKFSDLLILYIGTLIDIFFKKKSNYTLFFNRSGSCLHKEQN